MFMKNFLKPALAAAVVLSLPVAASASVVQMSTDNAVAYDLGVPNSVYRWDTNDEFALGDTSGQAYYFQFESTAYPTSASTQVTISRTGDFTGLHFYWSADATIDGGDTELAVSGSPLGTINTTFLIPDASSYYLLTTYDSVSSGGNLDYVVSAVPIPASGLLLLGGLGGLVAMRRRRRKA